MVGKGSYVVAYERDDDGWWVGSVKGVRGCHTQGRTIEETRRRIRDALSLFVDDAETATLQDSVRLASDARAAIREY